jgi:hypothetical protein
MEARKPAVPVPQCVALIICELCIEDARTHNKTLVGLFNQMAVESVPALHPRITVVMSLVNGRGRVPITLAIKDLSHNEVLFKAEGTAEFKDPLGELDVVMEFRRVVFPKAGTYAIELFLAGELRASRRFGVNLIGGKS